MKINKSILNKMLSVYIILMMIIPSVIAAPAYKDLKITDYSKNPMVDISSGIKSSSGDIVVDEKGKNHIRLKDTKPSKVLNEHEKAKVSFDSNELKSIDVDNDGKFGILETANGVVINQYTATSAQLTAGIDMTFSEVEVNGFSGYRSETFAGVKSGDILNIVDVSGDYIQTLTVDGSVPNYLALDENNISTWPGSPAAVFPYNVGYNDIVSGIVGTPGNITRITVLGGDYLNVNDSDISYDGANAAFKPENFTIFSKVKAVNPQPLNYETIYRKVYTGKGSLECSYGLTISHSNYYLGGYITTNATSYTVLSTVSTTPTSWQLYTHAHQTGSDILYINDTSVSTHSPTASQIIYDDSGKFRVGKFSPYNKNLIDYIAIYHEYNLLTVQHALLAGGQGISVDDGSGFVGYNVATGTEKIISNGGVSTSINYIDTSGGTRNVTIKTYYTEDTTKITQSVIDGFYSNGIWHPSTLYTQIEYIPSAIITTGTITDDYTLPVNSTPSISDVTSNDNSAAVSINSTHIIITTSNLVAGQTYTYDVYTTFSYDSYTDEPDAFYRTSKKLSSDINSAFVLGGTLFVVCIAVAMLMLLAGTFTGNIDYKVAIVAVTSMLIGEIILVLGLVIISGMFRGLT